MIRDLSEYQPRKIIPDTGYAVKGSTVVWADYDRILSDFFVGSLKKWPIKNREEIEYLLDRWLIKEFSFVSRNQFENTLANEVINRGGTEKEMFRLPRYNRSAVVKAHAPENFEPEKFRHGFVDVKGCGIAPPGIPQNRSHSTGLITLPEVISELLMQRLVEGIFLDRNMSVSGVPVYALISLGFKAFDPSSGAFTPAALLLRQSHLREISGNELPKFGTPQYEAYKEIEHALRRYGLSSSSDATEFSIWREFWNFKYSYGGTVDPRITSKHLRQFSKNLKIKPPTTVSCTNIQTTNAINDDPARIELVDFGHYDFYPGDPNPFAVMVDDRALNIGEVISKDYNLEIIRRRDEWINNSICNIGRIPGKSLAWLNPIKDSSDFGLLRPAIRLARILDERQKPKEFLDVFIARYVKEFVSIHKSVTNNTSRDGP